MSSVKNTSREKISVTFPDKTVIEGNNVTESFINCINKIGFNHIKPLNINPGCPLISETKHSKYTQKKLGEYFILTNISTKSKLTILEKINKSLNLNLKIRTY